MFTTHPAIRKDWIVTDGVQRSWCYYGAEYSADESNLINTAGFTPLCLNCAPGCEIVTDRLADPSDFKSRLYQLTKNAGFDDGIMSYIELNNLAHLGSFVLDEDAQLPSSSAKWDYVIITETCPVFVSTNHDLPATTFDPGHNIVTLYGDSYATIGPIKPCTVAYHHKQHVSKQYRECTKKKRAKRKNKYYVPSIPDVPWTNQERNLVNEAIESLDNDMPPLVWDDDFIPNAQDYILGHENILSLIHI